VRGWFPQLADTRLRQVTWPAISKHHDYTTAQLKAGVRMSTIHQRLRDEHGLAVSPASFRRYVAANVPEETRRAQVVVRNPRPAEAGEQAQIDYGQLGRWLDPVTGKLRTAWAFVMVLAYSRHMFVRPVLKMDQRAWTECHAEAFGFFGGVPARLVPEYVPRNIFRLLCRPGYVASDSKLRTPRGRRTRACTEPPCARTGKSHARPTTGKGAGRSGKANPSEEPGAVVRHAGICAGAARKGGPYRDPGYRGRPPAGTKAPGTLRMAQESR